MGKLNNVKQIAFSDELVAFIESKVQKIGISFPEYIRHLVLKDMENLGRTTTAEEDLMIQRVKEDIAAGNFTVLRDSDEVDSHYRKYLSVDKE